MSLKKMQINNYFKYLVIRLGVKGLVKFTYKSRI